jgi:hypothetical protein
MMFHASDKGPRWMPRVLWLAGLYSIAFGMWVALDPGGVFRLLDLPTPAPAALWQCTGLILAGYGVGYIFAAYAPLRYWPIVLVGLIGKIIGPVGIYLAIERGDLPVKFGLVNLVNDLIWWLPFCLILTHAWTWSHRTRHRWFD